MQKFFLFLCLCFIPIYIYCQNTCPRNMVDCHGICGRFIDIDSDGFCDLGGRSNNITPSDNSPTPNTNPVLVDTPKIITKHTDTTKPKTTTTIVSQNKNIITENKQNTNTIAPTTSKNVQQPPLQQTTIKADSQKTLTTSETTTSKPTVTAKTTKKPRRYNLITISLITFALYFISLYLSSKKIFSKRVHRQIWNVLLLLTFLVSGLFGLFLVIQINYNVVPQWFRTVLYWHVQFGIAMSLIGIFHFLWHLKYYINIFKKKTDSQQCY